MRSTSISFGGISDALASRTGRSMTQPMTCSWSSTDSSRDSMGGITRAGYLPLPKRVAWHYRRACARRRTDPLVEESLRDELASCPDHSHERREAADLVNELLNQLPDERKVVFVLSELEQLSMPEIAGMLRIPLNTAYSRLRLARRDFSRCLKRYEAKIPRSVP